MQLNFILVGKSSYISRICNGDFNHCCQSGTLFYKTNICDYTLHLETATDKPDGIIFMTTYDDMATNKDQLAKLIQRYQVPIVIAINKIDLNNHRRQRQFTELHIPYFEISAKTIYNYEKPIITLLRQIIGPFQLIV